MEQAIFKKKTQLLDPGTDGHLKEALLNVLEYDNSQEVLKKLRNIFISSYAFLCQQEGIKSIKNYNEEMALKDRVPDTIANWLTVLSGIFSGTSSIERVLDPVETAAILLLKLREWSCLNYEGRFLYGQDVENEASLRFNRLETEMDLLGDKDEILTLVLDSFKGFCANYEIDLETLLPAVTTYFVRVKFNYGHGERSLIIGLKSVAFDHVKFRAYSKDQHILSHIFESLTILSHIGKTPPDNYT